jgi:hypothetical protein
MKAPLELNFVDNRVYLNFWDTLNGKDVVCEVKGNGIFCNWPDRGVEPQPITIGEFVHLVRERLEET